MQATPWYRGTVPLILACVLLPPLGLILLWMRPQTKVLRKLVVSFGLLVLTFVHLRVFYGLRVELDGTGLRPVFSFYDPESHYEALEESREAPSDPATVTDPVTVQAASVPDSTPQGYWTDFRGPKRDGHYQQTPIRTDWPAAGLPELWRQQIGGGYASVVVAQGRVFTIEQRRGDEVVAAYDLETGKELWAHGWPALFQESMGGDGPRATPTWNEGRVYALGATGELHVVNAESGSLVWKTNILADNAGSNLTWAMSASPLIVDDKVIVLPGGSGGRSVVAYDKVSGKKVWSALDDKQAYTSPVEATLAGRRQIVVVSAHRLMGLAVEDGSMLWEYPWETSYGANSSQPLLVDENHVFISAGYGHGAALVKVAREGDRFRAQEIWMNNNMKAKFNSPVLHEGHVYGLDEGILACVDVWTGEQKWKGGRYGYGQVLLAAGHLVITTEQGDVVLVEATPESHQEIARFSAIPGKTWNNPAIADGRLIVRNQTIMACYNLS